MRSYLASPAGMMHWGGAVGGGIFGVVLMAGPNLFSQPLTFLVLLEFFGIAAWSFVLWAVVYAVMLTPFAAFFHFLWNLHIRKHSF